MHCLAFRNLKTDDFDGFSMSQSPLSLCIFILHIHIESHESSHNISDNFVSEERLSDIIKKDEIKIREDNTRREDDNKIPDIKLSRKPTKSEVVSNCKNVVKEDIGDGSSGCKVCIDE